MVPSPGADRRTLIRRLSFDLLGLPPTPEEVDVFAADPDPCAYEKLVDRYLGSPHYGERWGRHWLDVARFTESQGFEYDRLRNTAWHYRDYAIDSFNRDKPYDQFVREQIAGDVLEPVTSDGIIATSLLVCGPWDQAGSGQANKTQRMITREDELEDLISVVCQSFLALTVNCARCHDHKYDPIPTEDYYRIKSVFEGVRHGERDYASRTEKKARNEEVTALKSRLAALQSDLHELDAQVRKRAMARRGKTATPRPAGPTPRSRWTFEDGSANDSVGGLQGTLHGGAKIENGRLLLNGRGAFLRTAPISGDIREKTLEAWLFLPTLDQGGGGAITIETASGAVFDSIVFAERQPRKWMAGSDGFRRTKDLASATQERAGPDKPIHVAVVYDVDGGITVYRDGEPYADTYKPKVALQTYRGGDARILMGMRHTGGGRNSLNAELEQASLYDRALRPEEIAASFASSGNFVSPEELLAALTPTERRRRDEILGRMETLRRDLKSLPAFGKTYAGRRQQPPPTRIYLRGDVRSPGDVVSPGALSVFQSPKGDFGLSADAPEAARRAAFARWIAAPHHPLTARVMANRVWHYHFGRGIVPTTNDFGVNGEPPSHVGLLNWLASTFVETDWSVKKLHRLIVCSATYRQSSAYRPEAGSGDSDNRLLWRISPRRLEAEALRDAMLVVSDEINWMIGGPSFRPFETSNFGSTFYHPIDRAEPDFNRRTVYRMNVNSGKSPLLDAFDCPDPAVKTPRRRVTTTPLQALALMNNSFVQRQATRFAERLKRRSGDDLHAAVRLAFRHAFGREALGAEIESAAKLAREHGLVEVCWVLLNATEFIYVR